MQLTVTLPKECQREGCSKDFCNSTGFGLSSWDCEHPTVKLMKIPVEFVSIDPPLKGL